MRFSYLCLLLFVACSLKGPHTNPQDNFDKIMAIMKTKSTEDLIRSYGNPNEISEPEQDRSIQILRYKDSRIDAYVEKSNIKKITHLTIFFFEDFDNYTYLKKRFKDYKWIEEKLPDDKYGHVMTDRYLVKVPDIGMKFEYDDLAPKRKVMWIYFD
jgi:hypothetical protein